MSWFRKFSDVGVSASIPLIVFLLRSEKRLFISLVSLSITANTFLLNSSNELMSSASTFASTMVPANLEGNLLVLCGLRVTLSGMSRDSQQHASVQNS